MFKYRVKLMNCQRLANVVANCKDRYKLYYKICTKNNEAPMYFQ